MSSYRANERGDAWMDQKGRLWYARHEGSLPAHPESFDRVPVEYWDERSRQRQYDEERIAAGGWAAPRPIQQRTRIRFFAALKKAHELAEKHVERQGRLGPDAEAWGRDFDTWALENEQHWNAKEFEVIDAYARAALAYGTSNPGDRGVWAPHRWRGRLFS